MSDTNVKRRKQWSIYGHAVAVFVCMSFAIASGLEIFSDGTIANTIGDRHVSSVEIFAFRTGIFLQPWLCLAMWIESILGIYRMHMTLASTVFTSAISGAIVYFLLALIARRFPRAAWILVAVFGLLAGLNTCTFIGDMKAIAKMEALGYD